jgi:pantoate--beta-alanine ligase
MVIRKMMQLTNSATRVQVGSTLREQDGLAMSSRNSRLSETERANATTVYHTLLQMKEQLKPGSVLQLKENAAKYLTGKGFRVDYTALAKADTLELIDEWNGRDKIVALVAAHLNEVRLIDNMILF